MRNVSLSDEYQQIEGKIHYIGESNFFRYLNSHTEKMMNAMNKEELASWQSLIKEYAQPWMSASLYEFTDSNSIKTTGDITRISIFGKPSFFFKERKIKVMDFHRNALKMGREVTAKPVVIIQDLSMLLEMYPFFELVTRGEGTFRNILDETSGSIYIHNKLMNKINKYKDRDSRGK